jgi:hypothetical protein
VDTILQLGVWLLGCMKFYITVIEWTLKQLHGNLWVMHINRFNEDEIGIVEQLMCFPLNTILQLHSWHDILSCN